MNQKLFQQQIQQKVKTIRKNIQNQGFQVKENSYCTLLMYNLYYLAETKLTAPNKDSRLFPKIPRNMYFESQNKGSGQIILQTALQKLWDIDHYQNFDELDIQQQLKIYQECLKQLYLNDILKRQSFYINKQSFPNQEKIDKAIKLLKYFQQFICDDPNKAELILNYQTKCKIHIPNVFLMQKQPTAQQLSILLSPQEYILQTKQISPKQFLYHIKGTTHIYDSQINLLNYNIYRQKLQNLEYYTDEAETYQLIKNNEFKKPILPLQYLEDSYFFNELLDMYDYIVSDQILEKMQNFQNIQQSEKILNQSGQKYQMQQLNDCLSEQINRQYNLCKTQQKNNLQFYIDSHVWNTVECIDNYNVKSQIQVQKQDVLPIRKHSMTNFIAQKGVLVGGLPILQKQNDQDNEQNDQQNFTLQFKFQGRMDTNIKVTQQDMNNQRSNRISQEKYIQLRSNNQDEKENYKFNLLKFQQTKYLQCICKGINGQCLHYLRNQEIFKEQQYKQCNNIYQQLKKLNIQPTMNIMCQLLPNLTYMEIRPQFKQNQQFYHDNENKLRMLVKQHNDHLFYSNYQLLVDEKSVFKNEQLFKSILQQITIQIQQKQTISQIFINVGKQFKLQPSIIFNIFVFFNNQFWSKVIQQKQQQQQN